MKPLDKVEPRDLIISPEESIIILKKRMQGEKNWMIDHPFITVHQQTKPEML